MKKKKKKGLKFTLAYHHLTHVRCRCGLNSGMENTKQRSKCSCLYICQYYTNDLSTLRKHKYIQPKQCGNVLVFSLL